MGTVSSVFYMVNPKKSSNVRVHFHEKITKKLTKMIKDA